jgi:hypothetical protein
MFNGRCKEAASSGDVKVVAEYATTELGETYMTLDHTYDDKPPVLAIESQVHPV